jgi:hypothetical protein
MRLILIFDHKTVFIMMAVSFPSMLKSTKTSNKRICDLTVSAPLSRLHASQSRGGAGFPSWGPPDFPSWVPP